MNELSDAEVFGSQPGELSDAEVFGSPQRQQIPQAFIDRIRRGQELQDAIKQTGDSFDKRFNDVYGDPFEAAAARTRQSVAPGRRQEGLATKLVGAIPGSLLKQFVVGPILAAKELAEKTMAGEDIFADPDWPGKALSAAGLGMFASTHFSRVTAEGMQRIGELPRADDFQTAASVLTRQPEGFTAFHGSPNEFGRFRGATDVSTDRAFAERYRQPRGAESKPETIASAANLYNGKIYRGILHSDASEEIAKDLLPGKSDKEIIDWFDQHNAEIERGFVTNTGRFLTRGEALELTGHLDAKTATGARLRQSPGNLYQVEVGAKQGDFLNLDKPLSEQSEQVKGALTKAGIAVDDRLGMDAWDALRDATSADAAANALRDVGIAGTSRQHGVYSVFDPNILRITHKNDVSIAEENLRDLWEERGVHPAEAVHDADHDAFLHADLTYPNPEPRDRSGIARVTGSPVPEGTPRTELAKTGEAPIDAVLDSEVTNRNIDNPVINDSYDVPYSAGGSEPLEDPTVFIDRHFPRSMTIDGVTFDPVDPFTIHENLEQHVMDMLIKGGMDEGTAYKAAHHEWAEKAEGAWYRAHGIDQAKAEEAYRPFIDQIEHENPENPPPNLYRKPYPHQDVRSAKNETGPVPKPTAEEIARAKEIVARAMEDGELKPGAAGADITRPESLPSFDEEPPPRAGSLVALGREAVDGAFSLSRNIQYALDPMAMGSPRAMVVTKDAINAVRRVRWEWVRADAEIMRRFDPEQQIAMWDRLDEESVLRQEGKTSEHMGLATLARDERNFVEMIQDPSQVAWLHARDVGLVHGEGLPAYAPRIMLNMAAGLDDLGPQALNELGRNVFTRTAQMMRRKHLMAEETEAAAKELIAQKMEARGATPEEIAAAVEKIQIARNIRVVPWATARMEEAAIWKQMINNIREVGKQSGDDLIAVGVQKPGPRWFTIEGHPAFTEWRPRLEKGEDGRRTAVKDEDGNTIFDPNPIWIHPEFKGPMKAILDQGSALSKFEVGGVSPYGALMAMKGKVMTAIMNSPLIHNEVVLSKVAEAGGLSNWLGAGFYFKGYRLTEGNAPSYYLSHTNRAGELIEAGLNPIGARGSIQDITAMMETPNLQAGRSFTAKLMGAVGDDLFSSTAGDAVRRGIDRMGDFWHNTLLWDRVRDLQFGLADHLSDTLAAQGVDRQAADRVAAHFSNIIVGSIPKEAMSSAAREIANMLLFSRSFTLGNLSTFKQAAFGLPAPIRAQILRDLGIELKLNRETGAWEIPEDVDQPSAELGERIAKGLSRRKAFATIGISIGLYYIGNALLQNGFNIVKFDHTVDDEMQGYARRYAGLMEDVKQHPLELRHALGRLSPTYDNEPGKEDRIHIGYDKDGTAIYARNLLGKFGEELQGYMTKPLSMVKAKLNPMVSGPLEVLENDKGFGRKIYDENDTTDIAGLGAVARSIAHIAGRMTPQQQIQGGLDLLRGEGDETTNKLRLFGPMAGFTASVGAPGGMQKGEQLAAKNAFDARFSVAWPDIKKQIQRGDIEGASRAMMDIGVPMGMQRGLIRAATMPGNVSGRTLRDFFQYATPEQQERFLNAR